MDRGRTPRRRATGVGIALALAVACTLGALASGLAERAGFGYGPGLLRLGPPQTHIAGPPAPPQTELVLPSPTEAAWWRGATRILHHPGYQGLNLVVDPEHRPSVIVFVYHQVCPANWPLRNGPDYITPQRLAANLAYFRSHHIPTLTAAQFLAFLHGRATVPPGSVFLTFDNGLEGVYRYAYPLAARYKEHITTFLIGDRVHTVWQAGQKYLGWNQVRTMGHSGWVGIQSETFDLHSGETIGRRRFGPAMLLQWETYPSGHWESYRNYAARVRYAFMRERALFRRHLGVAPTLLVWPFSTYTRLAELEARAAGYQAAFAVYPGLVTRGASPDIYALPRDPATFMWDNVPGEYAALRSGNWKAILPPTNTTLVADAMRHDLLREEAQSTSAPATGA